MNRIRIGLVGLSVLALTGVSAGSALATDGRGTANASITLLDVQLGNIQGLKVLVDEGQGTLDAAHMGLSGPQAFGRLKAIDAKGIVNQILPDPPIQATAPGAPASSLATQSISFPPSAISGVGGLPIGVGALATGTINPVKVEAFQDASGSRSGVGTEIPSLDVLSGLVSIKDVKIGTVSSDASPASSTADTGTLAIGDISVLKLTSLLNGLGLGLADLNVGTLTGLVDKLGLPVSTASIPGASALNGITDIASVLNDVSGLASMVPLVNAASTCSQLTDLAGANSLLSQLPLAGVLGSDGLLGNLGLGSVLNLGGLLSNCSTSSFASTQNMAISTLQSTLGTASAPSALTSLANGLLGQVMNTLGDASLLSLSNVNLSALATAADSLAKSKAVTSVQLGTLKVGGLSIGALDLNATAAQVTALVNQAKSALNGVTSILGLGNLIDLGILEQVSGTKTESGYNMADAQVNTLRVSINPPALLSGALGSATALPVGNTLGSLLSGLPLGTGLADTSLAKAFSLTSLLSQPTTINIGSIRASSDYTTDLAAVAAPGGSIDNPVAPPVSGQLPRTGWNGALAGALAAVALGGAFGLSRVLKKRPPVEG